MTGRVLRRCLSLTFALLLLFSAAGCGTTNTSPNPADNPDQKFQALADEILTFIYKSDPSFATYLGIHEYDDMIADRSAAAARTETDAARSFRSRLDSVVPEDLSPEVQLDLEQTKRALDGMLLYGDVIRSWTKDPDLYSAGITDDAYVLIARDFAPPEQRLRSLVSRLQKMPDVLADARENLDNPPRIYTEIAIEQLDGNRDFFAEDLPAAFTSVTDSALLADFKTANDAVIAALEQYKGWLTTDLLPRSNGSFALGPDTYRKVLAADEMIDTPIDQLLDIARADLRRNQQAFSDAAREIDPTKPPAEVLKEVAKDHPAPSELLSVTQNNLDSLEQFVRDKQIIDVPADAPRVRVVETPPYLRATTSATMDTPGPFEATAMQGNFTMTLPDPSESKEEQDDFMTQWYYAAISNVSVHEVWPGHYVQFLYAQDYPSDVRKTFSSSSNSEGWAHYCEQMMLDEGLHADDPRYRLAQLQDALLRDVRFIVGIQMHTQGMTVDQAEQMFRTEAYQPTARAESEAKRGTSDATYGYYTMGKLMLLKLRDDYQNKMGADYSLKSFHDAFVRLGPLPIPLIRKAMLGEVGSPF